MAKKKKRLSRETIRRRFLQRVGEMVTLPSTTVGEYFKGTKLSPGSAQEKAVKRNANRTLLQVTLEALRAKDVHETDWPHLEEIDRRPINHLLLLYFLFGADYW